MMEFKEIEPVCIAVLPTIIGAATLHLGDCIEVMRSLPDSSVDAVVTDPPYGIRFMGKSWDGADIEARVAERRGFASHAPGAGPNGGHKSIAAEAGKYDLAPAAMKAFQAFSEEWAREAIRVLKPGGHLLSFASARTYHRMVCGIEDAGFEIRDQIAWIFGSGFPKSLDVSKAIDKAAGAVRSDAMVGGHRGMQREGGEDGGSNDYKIVKDAIGHGVGCGAASRGTAVTDAALQWSGWGTALKPAHEPIVVARKPLIGTVAANVLAFGTGALNIDGCRVDSPEGVAIINHSRNGVAGYGNESLGGGTHGGFHLHGRWPANLIHDGSDEVVAMFPQSTSGAVTGGTVGGAIREVYNSSGGYVMPEIKSSSGSAARFFYCAKASRADRNAGLVNPGPQFQHGTTLRKVEDAPKAGNIHPTVKPTDLMAYLCRLVTPSGGIVLDPFMGSGSTGKACAREGLQFIGIEMEPEYMEIARARIENENLEVALAKNSAINRQSDLFKELK